MKKTFELDFYGKKIVVENGCLAKQADGAVLVRKFMITGQFREQLRKA